MATNKILWFAIGRGETPNKSVSDVLAKHNGNVKRAAAEIGISRPGLHLFLKVNQWTRDPVTRQWSPPEKKLNQPIELIA